MDKYATPTKITSFVRSFCLFFLKHLEYYFKKASAVSKLILI